METDDLQQTVGVGPTQVTVRQLRIESGERVLNIRTPSSSHDLRLLTYYEPATTVIEGTLGIWGGTRLYAVDVEQGSVCKHDFDTDIVMVFPNGNRFLVVTETAAEIADAKCLCSPALLVNDEIIVEAQFSHGCLTIRDLQDRVRSVEVLDQT
jgi:hypothetical protein